MRALLAILLVALLASCAGGAPAAGGEVTPGAAWCFPANVRAKEGRSMLGCADTEALCRRAAGTARRWGAVAGILSLGSCRLLLIR